MHMLCSLVLPITPAREHMVCTFTSDRPDLYPTLVGPSPLRHSRGISPLFRDAK